MVICICHKGYLSSLIFPSFEKATLPQALSLRLTQDLINKLQSLVLPEAINYILSEDDSTLEMLETVTGFTLTMYPDLSIQEALAQLYEDLRQCSLKV